MAPASESPTARIAKSFATLASGDAIARLIAFGANVYIARRLGEEMFGVIVFASAVMLYFKNLGECGIDLLGVRHVAEDQQRIRSVTPSILGIRVMFSLLLLAVLVAGSLSFLEEPEASVLALYGLTLLAIGPNTKWVHLGQQRARPVAFARGAGELVFVTSVILLVKEPEDLTRVPVALFAGDTLTTVALFWWLRHVGFKIALGFDWKLVKPIFVKASPLVANVLLGLTIYNSDLIFLRIFRDRGTVGFYGAAYQLISFLINMAMAFSISLLPALTRLAADRVARNGLYRNTVAQVFAVGLPVAIGGSFLAPEIIRAVFGEEYAPAGLPLAILLWTIPFTLFKEVDLIGLLVCNREKTVMRMTAVAVGVNVVLNLALIPRYGMVGAAAATLATEAARAGIARFCARTEEYEGGGVKRMWKALAAGVAMAGVLQWMQVDSLALGLGVGAAVYLGALAAVGGIRVRGGVPVLVV